MTLFTGSLLAAAASVVLLGGWWLLPARPAALPAPLPLPPGPLPALAVSTLAGQPRATTYTNGRGAAASFQRPQFLVCNHHGTLTVSDGTSLRRIAPGGEVSTLAGEAARPLAYANGGTVELAANYDTDVDGQGPAARLLAEHLALGPDGAVYFTNQNAVRRVDAQGRVTTIAGQMGYGDESEGYRDGPGRQALFRMPTGLAVAPDGTVYVADTQNSVIRRISPAGVVSTLAGKAGERDGVDGTGAAARFDFPKALVLRPDGALLVADVSNGCIRLVTARGEVSTWAGHLTNKPRGTQPGADLDMDDVQSMVLAPDGTLYFTTVSERNAIRRLLPDRTEPVHPWAGEAAISAYADADTPGAARFFFPMGLALGPDGTLYVVDSGNDLVRAIAPGGQVRTVAGQAPTRSLDGRGAAATLLRPSGLALDAAGNVLVAGSGLLRRIDPQGAVTTLAGKYPASPEMDKRPEPYYDPTDVAVGPGGAVFFTDKAQNSIYRRDLQGKVSLWAGQPGIVAGDNDDGLLGKGRLRDPTTLAAAPDGTLYVGDEEGNTVRTVSPKGKLSTFAGHRKAFVSPFSNEGRYVYPTGVAVGPDGAVYVLQGKLLRYPPGGGRPTLLAGDPEPGYADGKGAAARFRYPTGLAVDGYGVVYVADRGNHLIRRVAPDGTVTTLAGQPGSHPLLPPFDAARSYRYGPDDDYSDPQSETRGDFRDGPAALARFNHPCAVAVAPDGTLYVADEDNNCVRVIRPAAGK